MNTTESGAAEIEANAIGPNGQNLPVRLLEQTEGNHIVEFTPNVSGEHKLHVKYGGEHVLGSPISYIVSSTTTSLSKSIGDARASGNGLELAHRGREASFVVFCPTTPNVQIEGYEDHADRIEPHIKSIGNNEWKVSYNILSVGRYEIRASCPNRGPLPGSPWTISCVDANKVVPVGGWGALLDQEGRLVLPVRFVFDTTQAGPGELLCTVDGRDLSKNQLITHLYK